jgi:hypothetical protein
MAAITFDTLKFVEKLRAAGVPPEQAEAQAHAIADAIGEVNVATRRDIEELDKSLQLEMRLLEQRLVMKLGSLVAVTIGVVAALVKLL